MGVSKTFGSMAPLKTLLVDDFEPFRRFVLSLLQIHPEFDVVGHASDGLEAVQKAEQLQPDVVLLDIGLPVLNGIEAGQQIRRLSPNSKIVFVSQESSLDVVEEALRVAGQAYVLKADAVRELLVGIEAVRKGEEFISRRLAVGLGANRETRHPHSQKDPAPTPADEESRSGHHVAFYRNHASLVSDFSRFMETGWKHANIVIVIASEEHRKGLFRTLSGRGWDIAGATHNGTYMALDANEMVSQCMIDDRLDHRRVVSGLNDLILKAAQCVGGDSSRVVACGEMSPILLARGNTEAAIGFERLTHETIKDRHTILCGYVLNDIRCNQDSPIVKKICAEHSSASFL